MLVIILVLLLCLLVFVSAQQCPSNNYWNCSCSNYIKCNLISYPEPTKEANAYFEIDHDGIYTEVLIYCNGQNLSNVLIPDGISVHTQKPLGKVSLISCILHDMLDEKLKGIFSSTSSQLVLQNEEILEQNQNHDNFLPANLKIGTQNIQKFVFMFGNLKKLPDSNIFATMTNLTNLNLDLNNLVELPRNIFWNLRQMKVLHLQRNNLATLPLGVFATLVDLEELYLGYNRLEILSTLDFAYSKKLRVLELQRNRLTHMESSWWRRLPQLNILNLGNNFITTIHVKDFLIITDLNKSPSLDVNLAHNRIRVVNMSKANQEMQKTKNILRHVNIILRGNQLDCNSSLNFELFEYATNRMELLRHSVDLNIRFLTCSNDKTFVEFINANMYRKMGTSWMIWTGSKLLFICITVCIVTLFYAKKKYSFSRKHAVNMS